MWWSFLMEEVLTLPKHCIYKIKSTSETREWLWVSTCPGWTRSCGSTRTTWLLASKLESGVKISRETFICRESNLDTSLIAWNFPLLEAGFQPGQVEWKRILMETSKTLFKVSLLLLQLEPTKRMSIGQEFQLGLIFNKWSLDMKVISELWRKQSSKFVQFLRFSNSTLLSSLTSNLVSNSWRRCPSKRLIQLLSDLLTINSLPLVKLSSLQKQIDPRS